eukprot:CAMPEP_0114616348 /NCGR_PEP_ID=MMETSP0168-20121206/6640_1 /TAXON_ID=95228 ORGANISM="Vannella sp., Strain DIVA3 517/6/12" /NCGR_SAMPLE_ID=MMETSP0168 /ASSEMBLY_ACC=CAM_ASM_000044 /LENGTH=652 /DNA_ID=CAMNT_0001827459 /DNA_START=21 /DNA_END=1979 /DNA_ORIENTATION=-
MGTESPLLAPHLYYGAGDDLLAKIAHEMQKPSGGKRLEKIENVSKLSNLNFVNDDLADAWKWVAGDMMRPASAAAAQQLASASSGGKRARPTSLYLHGAPEQSSLRSEETPVSQFEFGLTIPKFMSEDFCTALLKELYQFHKANPSASTFQGPLSAVDLTQCRVLQQFADEVVNEVLPCVFKYQQKACEMGVYHTMRRTFQYDLDDLEELDLTRIMLVKQNPGAMHPLHLDESDVTAVFYLGEFDPAKEGAPAGEDDAGQVESELEIWSPEILNRSFCELDITSGKSDVDKLRKSKLFSLDDDTLRLRVKQLPGQLTVYQGSAPYILYPPPPTTAARYSLVLWYQKEQPNPGQGRPQSFVTSSDSFHGWRWLPKEVKLRVLENLRFQDILTNFSRVDSASLQLVDDADLWRGIYRRITGSEAPAYSPDRELISQCFSDEVAQVLDALYQWQSAKVSTKRHTMQMTYFWEYSKLSTEILKTEKAALRVIDSFGRHGFKRYKEVLMSLRDDRSVKIRDLANGIELLDCLKLLFRVHQQLLREFTLLNSLPWFAQDWKRAMQPLLVNSETLRNIAVGRKSLLVLDEMETLKQCSKAVGANHQPSTLTEMADSVLGGLRDYKACVENLLKSRDVLRDDQVKAMQDVVDCIGSLLGS